MASFFYFPQIVLLSFFLPSWLPVWLPGRHESGAGGRDEVQRETSAAETSLADESSGSADSAAAKCMSKAGGSEGGDADERPTFTTRRGTGEAKKAAKHYPWSYC
jgi:hypothetical protein